METRYILKNKKVVAVDNLLEWAKWFETANRIVGRTYIDKDIKISTVFLSLDHSFEGEKPLLFETLVFGGELDGERVRYSTWEEAEKGHEIMVKKALNAKVQP